MQWFSVTMVWNVQAEDEKEATQRAYDALNDAKGPFTDLELEVQNSDGGEPK